MVHWNALCGGAVDFSAAIAGHSGDEVYTYKRADNRPLLLSLYRPSGWSDGKKYPFVMLIHGGGWRDRRIFADQSDWNGDYLGFLGRYLSHRGYLCAGVDYRLMDREPTAGKELIDLCEDVRDAVFYLRENADALGIDREKTAVLGESAGGHLAGCAVTLPMMDTGFFKTAILVNPVTDFSDSHWEKLLPANSAHHALQGLSVPEQAAYLSPAMHITQSTCPTLLLHGAADTVVLPFHSVKFHDLLTAAGQTAQLELIEGTNHAFLLAEYMQEQNAGLTAAGIAVRHVEAWLEEHIL